MAENIMSYYIDSNETTLGGFFWVQLDNLVDGVQ